MKILLTLILIYLIFAFVFTAIMFHTTFRPFQMAKYSTIAHWEYYKDRYHRRDISFSSNHNLLHGKVYETKQPKGLLVLSHGIWSGPEEYLMLISWFLDHHWNVFTYSYTGYNGNEGKNARGLPQSMLDLHAALQFIEQDESLSKLPRFLLGHSWGAFATCAVLNFHHKVNAIVALSGFNDPTEISVDVAKMMLGPLGNTLKWTIALFNYIRFPHDSTKTAVQGINQSDVPCMIIHGKNDGFIRYNQTSIISHKDEIINKNVTYMTLDDPEQSDHNNYLCNLDATRYYNTVMVKYHTLEKQYPHKKVPAQVQEQFFNQYDKLRLNQPNDTLYSTIESFLTKYL